MDKFINNIINTIKQKGYDIIFVSVVINKNTYYYGAISKDNELIFYDDTFSATTKTIAKLRIIDKFIKLSDIQCNTSL